MHCKPLYLVCRGCNRWSFRDTPLTEAAGVSPLALESLERLWVYNKHQSSSFFHQLDLTFRAFTSMIFVFLACLSVLFPLPRSFLFSSIPVMDYYIWAMSLQTVSAFCPSHHIQGWGLYWNTDIRAAHWGSLGIALTWVLRYCWQCRAAWGSWCWWGPALSAAHTAPAGWHPWQKCVQGNLTENSSPSLSII